VRGTKTGGTEIISAGVRKAPRIISRKGTTMVRAPSAISATAPALPTDSNLCTGFTPFAALLIVLLIRAL